jgi:hypothetical protein
MGDGRSCRDVPRCAEIIDAMNTGSAPQRYRRHIRRAQRRRAKLMEGNLSLRLPERH